MYKIDPYLLWIGNVRDAAEETLLRKEGIQAIVFLAREERMPILPRDFILLRFPLTDDGANESDLVHLLIRTVQGFLNLQIPTLIACSAGMSRSPVIASAALSKWTSLPITSCLERISGATAAIDVSPALWNHVKMLCEEVE